jgi:CRP-like cAMP-binding protein
VLTQPHMRNRILAALPVGDFALLDAHLEQVKLEQGLLLYEPASRVEQVYFPYGSMISLLALLRDKQEIELATIGREGVAGTMLILGSGLSPNRANVQVAGDASRIDIGHFTVAFEQSAALRRLVIGYNEAVLGQIQTTAACNALHSVEARLARWILQTSDHIKSDDIPLTQDFIAQMLAVQRTSVTLVARVFQSAGLVSYARGHIRILDRGELENTACECYDAIRDRIRQDLP